MPADLRGWSIAPPGAVWTCPECRREVRPHYQGGTFEGVRLRCPECGATGYYPPGGEIPWTRAPEAGGELSV